MNKVLLLSFALSLGSLPQTLRAELVQFPVGPAAWTIDATASKGPETKSPIPQSGNSITKVEVRQGDKYRSSLVTYRNGESHVNWDLPGTPVILREDPHGTPFLVYKSDFYFVPFLPSDFAWLNPGLLQEKEPIPYGGKLCFHYKSDKKEAWVDSKTLFPVALDDGIYLVSYSFQPPPVTPPVLPEKYQKIVTAFAATMGIPHTKDGSN